MGERNGMVNVVRLGPGSRGVLIDQHDFPSDTVHHQREGRC
jgi:hypothetical protein